MFETLALKESLRKSLQHYKMLRPHLSLRAIAKNSGVNRYFLTKLLDENDTSASLDLNQVLILTKYITGKDSVTEAIDASSKEVSNALKKVVSIEYEDNSKVIDSDLFAQVDITDRTTYFVLVLACYRHGSQREYIMRILGERGEEVLKDLLVRKIVVEDSNGRIRLARGSDFTYDFSVMLRAIPEYLSFYRPEHTSQGENSLHVISEGVCKEALLEIKKVHHQAYKQIRKIISKPESSGDIPLFSVACMDRLLSACDGIKNYEKKGEGDCND